MRASALTKALDRWDENGIWLFSSATLRLLFPEPAPTHYQALRHHTQAGLLGRAARGIYFNPRARSMPSNPLETLVSWLRPWDLNYVSLESALAEHGVVSQMPGRLTCMTTGQSAMFHTPFGDIEFVRTKRRGRRLKEGLHLAGDRTLPVADAGRALADLRATGRNLDLVNEQVER